MGTEKSPIWFQVSGLRPCVADMAGTGANRRTGEKRTEEPQNRRISNVEGWYRCALSFL